MLRRIHHTEFRIFRTYVVRLRRDIIATDGEHKTVSFAEPLPLRDLCSTANIHDVYRISGANSIPTWLPLPFLT